MHIIIIKGAINSVLSILYVYNKQIMDCFCDGKYLGVGSPRRLLWFPWESSRPVDLSAQSSEALLIFIQDNVGAIQEPVCFFRSHLTMVIIIITWQIIRDASYALLGKRFRDKITLRYRALLLPVVSDCWMVRCESKSTKET